MHSSTNAELKRDFACCNEAPCEEIGSTDLLVVKTARVSHIRFTDMALPSLQNVRLSRTLCLRVSTSIRIHIPPVQYIIHFVTFDCCET